MRRIPLPRGWNRRVKAAVLQVLALSHYGFTTLLAQAAHDRNRRTRWQAEIERLEYDLALLQEETRIKDSRMTRLPAHRRPFYTPLERMAILELRAARGWSAQQTADRFQLTLNTVAAWMARLDESGPNALLQLREPVNKFPDLVRYARMASTAEELMEKVQFACVSSHRFVVEDPSAGVFFADGGQEERA
jgi:DNA-binding transcriptional regulator YiaG